MHIPPEPILRGAVRWLERLPEAGVPRLRELFAAHPAYSDLTPTQYEVALSWIRSCGLLDDGTNSRSTPEVKVLQAAIVDGGALWLRDADSLVQSVDDLPKDVARAAEALGIDDLTAFQLVSGVWGKVDLAERSRIGIAGEALLVDLLQRSTRAVVEHVALIADGYGYDIAITRPPAARVHLEVKSTTRQQRVVIHLSRNEFETMLRDPDWWLVVARLTPDLQLDGVATVPKEWIRQSAPTDRNFNGRWESFRLEVPPGVPLPGLPMPTSLVTNDPNGLISGLAW